MQRVVDPSNLAAQSREDLKRRAEVLKAVAEIVAQRQADVASKQERHTVLDDFPRFCTNVCAHNIEDQGDGLPWFVELDNPESPHARIVEHLNKDNDKDKLVLASRGCCKTELIQDYLTQTIFKDRNFRLQIGSETGDLAEERSDYIRGRCEVNEPYYGPFRTLQWRAEKFTIARKAGRGSQPTVSVCAPNKAATGKHPMLRWLDDFVGENTARSPAKMANDIDWHRRISAQNLAITKELISGTMWEGYHAYRYMIEEVEGKRRGEGIPYIAPGIRHLNGKVYDILIVEAMDQDGNPTFPFFTKEFLQKQMVKLGTVLFAGQFMQQIVSDGEMKFDTDGLQWCAAPNPKQAAIRVLIADFGTSQIVGPGGSRTAVIIADILGPHKVVIRDAIHGKFRSDAVIEKVSDLITRWQPGAMYAEDTSDSANVYIQWINAYLGEKGHPQKAWFRLPRKASKDQRFQAQLRPMLENKELYFERCQRLQSIYREDPSGRKMGIMAEQLENYAYNKSGTYDLIDVVSDLRGMDKYGIPVWKLPTPDMEERKEPRNWIEKLRRELEDDFVLEVVD